MLSTIRKFPFFILIVMVFSLAMILPALIALEYKLYAVMQAFLRSMVFIFIIATMIGVLLLDRETRGDYRDHLLSLLATFLFLPFILAIPIIQATDALNFWQASFEMLSSLTTTGASVILDVTAEARYPLLIYTALVAWLGAFLIIVIAYAVLEPINIGGFEIVADIGEGAKTRHTGGNTGQSDRLIRYVRLLAPPYLLITLLLMFLLAASGERVMFAAIHAMSIISTSGIMAYERLELSGMSWIGEAVMAAFLFLALSRRYLLQIGRGNLRPFMRYDPEFRTALFFIILTMLAIMIAIFRYDYIRHLHSGITEIAQTAWGAFFTGISFLTTNGFVSEYWHIEVNKLTHHVAAIYLIGLAMIGGGVATTAGGIKLLRIYAITRLTTRELGRLVDPDSIAASGRSGRQLRKRGGINAFVFLMLFIAGISIAGLAFTAAGLDFEAGLIAAISAASNCGPVLEIIADHALPVADMSAPVMMIYAIVMIFGRVEVFVLIALFNPEFWSNRRNFLEDRVL